MTEFDSDAHRASVEAWRAERYAALRRDLGWLTLAGLGWLKEGTNTIGAAPASDVVLPSGPGAAGTISLTDGRAVARGRFTIDGRAVDGVTLATDAEGEATLLELGSLRLCLIERSGRLAVRTWDLEAPARKAFRGIDHWPVDRAWLVDARFEPAPSRALAVPDVLGTSEEQASPGDVVFDLGGATHRLQALAGGDSGDLWLVFGDATNGVESYGGGRFLYTDPPGGGGRLAVDFNRSYNPPCVFSPYATCPLPWPANRLSTQVEAGERDYHAQR